MELVNTNFEMEKFSWEPDPRISHLPEISWMFIISLISGYLLTVKIWAPNYMRDRKAFDLTYVTRVYNIFQTVASLYFAGALFNQMYIVNQKSIVCAPPDRSTDEDSLKVIRIGYFYFYLRIFDFLDTLFFVLRKKDNQVTFLHVFHHVAVVFAYWFTSRYGLSNYIILTGIMNSIVHSIMYSYYFLSTLGPSVKPYLWWKRHLTKLQIGQFLIMLVHLSVPMFKECGYPMSLIRGWLACIAAILALFVNFYVQSYLKSRNTTAKTK